MTTREAPSDVRRVESEAAAELAGAAVTFDELQTVLRCCERLLVELGAQGEERDLLVEALWTTTLLGYGRCFASGAPGRLTVDDLETAHPGGDATRWHEVLTTLRDHHLSPLENPREVFSVGVAVDDGKACGIAVTSARQPGVDEVTVRQTGALAYALSALVDRRIQERQQAVLTELSHASKRDLDVLEPLAVAAERSDG